MAFLILGQICSAVYFWYYILIFPLPWGLVGNDSKLTWVRQLWLCSPAFDDEQKSNQEIRLETIGKTMKPWFVILSILLQFWPFRFAPRKVSTRQALSASQRQDWMVWLPIVGWICVVYETSAKSTWLKFEVVDIRRCEPAGPPAPMIAREKSSWAKRLRFSRRAKKRPLHPTDQEAGQ